LNVQQFLQTKNFLGKIGTKDQHQVE